MIIFQEASFQLNELRRKFKRTRWKHRAFKQIYSQQSGTLEQWKGSMQTLREKFSSLFVYVSFHIKYSFMLMNETFRRQCERLQAAKLRFMLCWKSPHRKSMRESFPVHSAFHNQLQTFLRLAGKHKNDSTGFREWRKFSHIRSKNQFVVITSLLLFRDGWEVKIFLDQNWKSPETFDNLCSFFSLFNFCSVYFVPSPIVCHRFCTRKCWVKKRSENFVHSQKKKNYCVTQKKGKLGKIQIGQRGAIKQFSSCYLHIVHFSKGKKSLNNLGAKNFRICEPSPFYPTANKSPFKRGANFPSFGTPN